MGYSELLKTEGRFRVRICVEEGPEEPYDDGQSPLLRIERGRYSRSGSATHVMVGGRPTDDDGRIEEAANRWADDLDLLEKYLRAFQGATQIVRWDSDDYTYITYDTPRWRKYVGFDGVIAPLDGLPADSINLDEYRAWCEGDVWYYVIEKEVTWVPAEDHDADVSMTTWEVAESCGGYYGQQWAEEVALDEFASFLECEASRNS